MVEVLVGIVVLSFGLLGVVGLQAASLKFTRDARIQSVAVGLGRELGEMMRANAQVAALTTNNPYLGSFSGSPMTPGTASHCLAVGSSCASATDVANAEMTDWLSRVSDALPGARVTVCTDSAPFDANGLPVWACTASGTTTDNATYIKIGWTREDTKGTVVESSATNARPFVVFPVTPSGQM
ncbi:type IV pilus modification protein PilV [Ottowia sp.]|uniref:type IV pilus modification protein PilV n=1 Tax=Ottowia sp. TaxID=1898956 RepID=UPI0026306962|nr:type IV pilus modification protein PilV [Ottowia sp.]